MVDQTEGIIETVSPNEDKPTFYVQEVITETVVDTHQEEQEDGSFLVVADEDQDVRTRLFGPFVQPIADEQVEYAKNRFKSLALAGKQEVTLIPADEQTTGPQQDPIPAATEPNVSDALTGEQSAPEPTADVPTDVPDTIATTADGDAPSWSVTPVNVPQSDQADVPDGATTNPPLTAPAGNPDPDAVQPTIPSAPDEDPNTTDAITTAATEADDSTLNPVAPPTAPESPVVEQGPADGTPITDTVADQEPVIPDAAPTIPVADTAGDSGADQINEDAPLNVTDPNTPVETIDASQPDPAADPAATTTADTTVDASTPADAAPAADAQTETTTTTDAPADQTVQGQG